MTRVEILCKSILPDSRGLEIGGKGKGLSQFKGVQADQKIILAQGGACSPGRIPLEMLGFLS